ncbi:hypothetical protein C1645_740114 [Glomus cerebriforme]|uniref:Uncharacterized protein n=1 Tax=Glomus cerebriforme TaxID=658196 RepID=A0A397SX14_9GLOM|nr:hypothetical protein C1645_740114 [Glomus cerebriforme]
MSGYYYNNKVRYLNSNSDRNNYYHYSQNDQGTTYRNDNGLTSHRSYNEQSHGYFNNDQDSYRNYSDNKNLSCQRNNFDGSPHSQQDYENQVISHTNSYDTRSQNRQSNINCTIRAGRMAKENVCTSFKVSDAPVDDILSSWGEPPSEICDWSTKTRQLIGNWNAASQDPSLLKGATQPDDDEIEWVISQNDFTTSDSPVSDNDEVEWVVSHNEFISSNLASTRPHTPLLFELLDEDNKKNVDRNNERNSRDQNHEENFFDDDDKNNYKGINFLPPLPIVPVSTINRPTSLPNIDRIFENDSLSSIQSFENLSKLAKSIWNDFASVPLDWANEQDVNLEEYLKVNGEKLRESSEESNKRNDIKLPERDLSSTANNQPFSSITKSTSRISRTEARRRSDARDYGYAATILHQ